MKRLAYLVMSVVLLVGCNGTMEDDSYLISNFDPTEPGLILFCPSSNLYAELQLYFVFFLLQLFCHFPDIACTLPPLGNGARLSSCIPPGAPQNMAHDTNRCSRNLIGAYEYVACSLHSKPRVQSSFKHTV